MSVSGQEAGMGDGALDARDGGGAGAAPGEGPALVLRVAYDGTGFSGFAPQEGQPHVRTVAGELSRCLRTLLRREVALTCAGRTDAGVHARGQHVSLALTPREAASLDAARLVRSLGALLPEDIALRGVLRAAPGFSARFDALSRTYRYRMSVSPERPLFCARWAWWAPGRGGLDLDAMREAALRLVGEHDFKSFCKASSAEGRPTSRFVESVLIWQEEQLGERQVVVQVRGNAFLHNMVRTMVGTLAMVGEGRRSPAWVSEVLAARDRRAAGPCAPACGLTFWDVRYPEGSLAPWARGA